MYSNFNSAICVTIDYELFGNGAGSIKNHIVTPADKLLDFFKTKNIRATFFVETAELLFFAKALRAGKGPASLACDYSAIKFQLEKILSEGHDIQLHIHPQWWNGAVWNGEFWQLNSHHYSLLQFGIDVFKEMLLQGKEFLEDIGIPINKNYNCHIFRAGGLNFDRSEKVGRALCECGFMGDSSVSRGYSRDTSNLTIDYRDLVDIRLPSWQTLDGSPSEKQKSNFIEIPIWAVKTRQWKKIISCNRLSNKFSQNVAGLKLKDNMEQAEIPKHPVGMLAWLAKPCYMLWDFCLMTGTQLIQSFIEAKKFHKTEKFFPLVMIGHTKEVRSLKPLGRLHKYLNEYETVEWVTMSEVINLIR